MKNFYRLLLLIISTLGFISIIVVLLIGSYFYFTVVSDLPKIDRLEDYKPKAVTSILSDDQRLIGEIFEERRYPLELDKIPIIVKQAFLAAEDSSFYSHPGIDFVSILRAIWVNFKNQETKQGASTITQQVVKSLLLNREKTYSRKIKEAILSYKIEKALSKDEILSIYLNEIFLGNGSYGVKAAAKVHFGKELEDLTIAETAFIAGLPTKPTELSKIKNRAQALNRQKYVLRQMKENNFIDVKHYESALEEDLNILNTHETTIYKAPYFTSHVIRLCDEIFSSLNLRNAERDPGGYIIETTVNADSYDLSEKALRNNLKQLDKRQGWRGPLELELPLGEDPKWSSIKSLSDIILGENYKAEVTKIVGPKVYVRIGEINAVVDFSKENWAKKLIDEKDRVRWVKSETIIKIADVIEVSLVKNPGTKDNPGDNPRDNPADNILELSLDQTPKVEGAMVVANALTGEVKSIIGGYDFSRSQFNRATQGLRQPGSSFKPFVYLTALEKLHYTPATVVPDSPISMTGGDGKLWTPQNYDQKYYGPITLRTALQLSRNVVSVYLARRAGVESVIETARRLGISTPLAPNMSISLGTSEVTLLEMVHAYGAFAAEGWLADMILITKITDRNGNVVFQKFPNQRKVIEDEEAFLMANMMKGVVERGTAQVLKKLERPVAGKTGTTNDLMDAWFIGYTPEWVAGVWVGFDQKKNLGSAETGGRAAAPAFLYFMEEFLKDTAPLDFNIPDGVSPTAINIHTGNLASVGDSDAFIEYFKAGTEPTMTTRDIELPKDYLLSDEF